MTSQDVLDFWFGPQDGPEYGKARREWFVKDAAFDAQIRARFGALIDQAINGGLREWDVEGARGVLARIIVLDQFTRNAFRDTPRSFEGDVLALGAAQKLVEFGADRELLPVECWFAYMPFEHSEDGAMQEKSVTLFTALSEEQPGFEEALDYAHRHRGVIARFGRFPHRNEILGRNSTEEEVEFLKQPGSRF
ncbi:DUF924 domain-containing protein [Massilia arenosa]|uniref:DUF924 domain-containing protein n=1 Tax=Zemynaea arenosa TaxID=2561931 RepID=A0A4Y9SAU9_9BURK|nr:DUF924 family protein [Massilia arenosa]TFW16842.1 DUF924 domain-containing protein [Massilia arenosa]